MTTILSTTAVAHLAERRVRTYGALLEADVLAWLERLDVKRERAEHAIDLACLRNRLVRETENGETRLRRPLDWRTAA